MSPEWLGMTMLLLLVGVIMIGFPTAFTLMALGIIFGFIGLQFRVFDLAVNKAFQLMTNDVLIAIPLFLFMGYIIERSGLLDTLFRSGVAEFIRCIIAIRTGAWPARLGDVEETESRLAKESQF